MNKIKKQRIIVLSILAGCILLWAIFGIVSANMTHNLNDWIYNNYHMFVVDADGKELITKPVSLAFSLVFEIIGIIIYSLFIGLAFKYTHSKSSKIQGRKWPYIILLVFASIAIILSLYGLFQENHSVFRLPNGTASIIVESVKDKVNSSYGGILPLKVLTLIINIAIITACILGLVLISKAKSEKDMMMTEEVMQTGRNEIQNDMP